MNAEISTTTPTPSPKPRRGGGNKPKETTAGDFRDDRIKKVEAITASGKMPFATKYEVTHTSTQVDDK